MFWARSYLKRAKIALVKHKPSGLENTFKKKINLPDQIGVLTETGTGNTLFLVYIYIALIRKLLLKLLLTLLPKLLRTLLRKLLRTDSGGISLKQIYHDTQRHGKHKKWHVMNWHGCGASSDWRPTVDGHADIKSSLDVNGIALVKFYAQNRSRVVDLSFFVIRIKRNLGGITMAVSAVVGRVW